MSLILDAGTWTLNSDTGSVSNTTIEVPHIVQNGVQIISVQDFTIASGATLRAVGTLPLAIMVWGKAQIDGTIDMSSTWAVAGAGANPSECPSGSNGPRDGGAEYGGDGGGGGGGFQGRGGDGGDGNDGDGDGDGGNGGDAWGRPTILRGGCKGADAPEGSARFGGNGGGAIALLVRERLTIGGGIHAGGGGGGGAVGGGYRGGGGGGSGGMIKLMAHELIVTATARVAANGGQGGGGNGRYNAEDGENGRLDGTAATSTNSDEDGSPGGAGGYGSEEDGGDALKAWDGGGGGGGGAGYILLHFDSREVNDSATVSPRPDPVAP